MNLKNLIYLAILIILITNVSAYSKTNLNSWNIEAKEQKSALCQSSGLNSNWITPDIKPIRTSISIHSSIYDNNYLQTNLQNPEQDLLTEQSIIIRENQRRTTRRLLTYLKN